MGQTSSKRAGSRKKKQKQKQALQNSDLADLNETDSPLNETGSPLNETDFPLNEETDQVAAQIDDPPANRASIPHSNEAVGSATSSYETYNASNTIAPIRPGQRDFWDEAVQILPRNYQQVAEKWKNNQVDRTVVGRMVNDRLEECKDKQKTINVDGRQRILCELFENIACWLQAFASVGDTTIPYKRENAVLPWAGFQILLQITPDETQAYGGMVAGLERATWITSYLSAHERLYNDYFGGNYRYSDLNNDLVQNLVQLYMVVLSFLIEASTYFANGSDAIAQDPVVSNWAIMLIKAINDRKTCMEDYASLVHKSNVHQGLKHTLGTLGPFLDYISQGARVEREREYKAFLAWLSEIDYTEDHQAHRSAILKGTWKWIIGDIRFHNWKQRGSLLWLHGASGSGKTKIISIIIDHLTNSDENQTVAYVYCTKRAKQEDPSEIFRTILKQLAIQLPSRFSDPLMEEYKERMSELRDRGSVSPLTLEESAHFIKRLATIRPTTLIIDGLDQCRETTSQLDGRRELLYQIKGMIEPAGRIKILLSSRKGFDDIEEQLCKCPDISVNIVQNYSDIPIYIESKVRDLARSKLDLWGGDSSLERDIIGTLKQNSDGTYQWADLQIDYLHSLGSAKAVRNRLHKLPISLRQLYDEIYERISEQDRIIAQAALSWLLCAQRRLDSREFLAAVSAPRGGPLIAEKILRICRNLVIRNASGSFELAHPSVSDYLETRQEYRGGRPDVLVAKRCLEEFEYYAPEGDLLPYASIYWAHHCTRVQTEEAVAEALATLFRNEGRNYAFEKRGKAAIEAAKALRWDHDVARRLRDTGSSPLLVVCVFGFPKLLEQWTNSPMWYRDVWGTHDMVVYFAIKWGNEEIVRMLLQSHSGYTVDRLGMSPAFWAAIYGHRHVLEVLKQLDGGLNAKDNSGWTAWHWLVSIGHTKGLKELLGVDAGVDVTDLDGCTPLHWAAFLGRIAEMKALVTAGHRLDASDNSRLTPLRWLDFIWTGTTAGENPQVWSKPRNEQKVG